MWTDFISAGKELLILFIAFAGGYIFRAVLVGIAKEKDNSTLPLVRFTYDRPKERK